MRSHDLDPASDLANLKPIPHHLIVTVEGEEQPRRIAVPQVRRRWSRLDAVLSKLVWLEIDARDKDGATIALLRRPDEAAAPAPVELSGAGVTIRERELLEFCAAQSERTVNLVMQAQHQAVEQQRGLLNDLTQTVQQSLRMLNLTHEAVLRSSVAAAQINAGNHGGDDDSSGMEIIAPLVGMMARGDGKKLPPMRKAPDRPKVKKE